MANVNEEREVILNVVVDNNKALAQIAEWNELIEEQKDLQEELRKQYKSGEIDQKTYHKAMAQSKEETKQYGKQVQELSKEVQNNIRHQTEAQDSLRAMRAELSNMTKQYDSLSKEMREGDVGKTMQGQIQQLITELKNAEEETGRFQRNVGNYAMKSFDAFSQVAGGASGIINPIKNATGALQVMSKTPVIAILGLLANVLSKVISALKSSEDNTNRMTVALAPFQVGTRAITKLLQRLGSTLASVAEWLGKVADKLGLVSAEMKAEQELTKAEIALQDSAREANVQNAKDELEIAKLKNKAAQTNLYTEQERLEFVQQAAKLEEDIMKRNLANAQEEVRLLEERAAQADNSDEENEKLAQAYQKLAQVETDYFNSTRKLDSQEASLTKSMDRTNGKIETRTDLLKKAAEEMEKTLLDTLEIEVEMEELTADQMFKIAEEEVKRRTDLRKSELANRLELAEKGSAEEAEIKIRQLEMQRAQDEADLLEKGASYEQLLLLREVYAQREQEVMDGLAEHERQLAEARIKVQQAQANAIAQAFGDISSAIQQMDGQSRASVTLAKTLGLAQIYINQAIAIANAVKLAQQSSHSWVEAIAATASAVASVVASTVSAFQSIKKAKFASGGLVTGPGSGTSDSIPAQLSNGESVMTAKATSMFAPLLSAINQAGGGVGFNAAGDARGFDFMASAVAAGMKAADLYVSVEEIDRVGQRTESIKALSTL